MRTRLASLAIVVASLTVAHGQNAHPDVLLRDRVLLKTRTSTPVAREAYDDTLVSTGDGRLDALLAREGVRSLERIFRAPPRGWREESAARAIGLERWMVGRFDVERADLDALVERLARDPAIESCEECRIGFVADTVPDDPDFAQQYALQNGKLNGPQAWDLLRESSRVVAIVDTGADLDHHDLQANLWHNPGEIPGNGIDDDLNGYVDDLVGWDFAYQDADPDDQFGHGIHTSGTVGAVTGNSRQVAGVCWRVPIMEVQVFDRFGSSPVERAAAGMVYAADNGCSVMSNSWGYLSPYQVLEDAVKYAAALDVVVVAAAHNFGSQWKVYPAAYPQVMGVIATDANDRKTSWSDYGDWCDLAAPGDDILSLYLNDSTAYMSGTSMSTPHVAGAAALVRELNPSLDAIDTRWVLNYSAKDLGTSGFDIDYGWGRLDLLAALERARSLSISTNVAHRGDTVSLTLFDPDEAWSLHVLLASRNGRAPGFSLLGFDPADHRQVPLNPDTELFRLIVGGGAGVFGQFLGYLDGGGRAHATFQIPTEPQLAGATFDFGFLTFNPASLAHVRSVSTSVHLLIQ